jgi:hypothetical protein
MKQLVRQRLSITLVTLFASFLAYPAILRAQNIPDAVSLAARQMGLAAGEPVEITRSRVTGVATFVTTKPGRPIPVIGPSLGRPENRALAFLDSHGTVFGLKDSSRPCYAGTIC